MESGTDGPGSTEEVNATANEIDDSEMKDGTSPFHSAMKDLDSDSKINDSESTEMMENVCSAINSEIALQQKEKENVDNSTVDNSVVKTPPDVNSIIGTVTETDSSQEEMCVLKLCEKISLNIHSTSEVNYVEPTSADCDQEWEAFNSLRSVSSDPSPDSPSVDCYFQLLPDEIMHHIFRYLTLGELCTIAAHVSRRWCDLACDPIHWQALTIGHLPNSALTYCLRRAPLLKYLSLERRDSLTTDEMLLFSKKCPLIRELDLAFCENLSNEQIKILAANCGSLQRLNMEGCPFVDDESLRLVSRIKKLTSLNVSHCSLIQTEGVEALAQNLPCIKELNIDGIPNVIDSAVFTLVLHHGDHLDHLDLDGVELTDAAVQALSKCDGITRLHFSFAELLTDTALLYIKKMKALKSLRLKKGAYFSREGLVDMFRAGFLSNIESLCLSECVQLYDDGIQALVKCCKKLRYLDLQWCWFITDTGLEAIVNNCHEMENMNLVGLDKIRGHCLENISKTMVNLQELDLQQCNQIIDDLVVDLVREMPQLVAYNYYGERFQYTKDGVLVIE